MAVSAVTVPTPLCPIRSVCNIGSSHFHFSFSLKVLNLSGNQLSILPSISPLDENNNIMELYAARNKLTDASLSIIAG